MAQLHISMSKRGNRCQNEVYIDSAYINAFLIVWNCKNLRFIIQLYVWNRYNCIWCSFFPRCWFIFLRILMDMVVKVNLSYSFSIDDTESNLIVLRDVNYRTPKKYVERNTKNMPGSILKTPKRRWHVGVERSRTHWIKNLGVESESESWTFWAFQQIRQWCLRAVML